MLSEQILNFAWPKKLKILCVKQFLKSKMTPRHFVANYDKEYAYTMHKTNMTAVVQSEMLRPLPHNFDLLAITGEGVCVNRKNILDFMDRKYLTMSYDYK